jgi:hypothetical protein
MPVRARGAARAGAAGPTTAAVDETHRSRRAAAAAPPAPLTPPRAPSPPRAPPSRDAWECVICWSPLPAPAPRQRASRRATTHKRSLSSGAAAPRAAAAAAAPPCVLPGELECNHACCARCLADYVRVAASPAARARARIASGGACLTLRCPGANPAGDGWDQRCPTQLPAQLLAPLMPHVSSAAAADGFFQSTWDSAWGGLAAQCCPWCGEHAMPVMDGSVGSSVRCAGCLRVWCCACGARLRHANAWHAGCILITALEAAFVLFSTLVLTLFLGLVIVVARTALRTLPDLAAMLRG